MWSRAFNAYKLGKSNIEGVRPSTPLKEPLLHGTPEPGSPSSWVSEEPGTPVKESFKNGKTHWIVKKDISVTRARTSVLEDGSEKDILQFTCPLYFATEDERFMQIDIMRLGELKGQCSVEWYTENHTAINGVHYVAADGVVNFESGEIAKAVHVKMIDDDTWHPVSEFRVKLRNPVNCELGMYLFQARVKIIDNDLFPSNKYQKEIEEDALEDVGGLPLLWEYVKFNMGVVPGVRRATIFNICGDQLMNLYFLLQLYLQVYLVDVVLNTREDNGEKLLVPNQRMQTALMCGLIYFLPMTFLAVVKHKKAKMNLKGISIAYLQKSIVRRYLHYHDYSRDKVKAASLVIGMLDEATEVVSAGYLRILESLNILGKLVIFSYFVLAENSKGVVAIVVMGTLMIGYAFHSVTSLIEKNEEVSSAVENLLGSVLEICSHLRLIINYQQRPRVDKILSKAVNRSMKAGVPLEMVNRRAEDFPQWLSAGMVAMFIAFESKSVLDGVLSLGTFLATIKVYQEIGDQFGDGFDCLTELLASKGALITVTKLLNLTTDLPGLMLQNRRRRELSKSERLRRYSLNGSEPTLPTGEKKFATDKIDLRLVDVSFSYDACEEQLFKKVNLKIAQGSSISIVGPRRTGKRTLIDLLTGAIYPNEGLIFVPSHLRVVLISSEPLIFESLSLLKNLSFGCPRWSRDQGTHELIKELLTKFEAQNLLDMLEQDLENKKLRKMKNQEGHGKEEDEGDDFQNETHHSGKHSWSDKLSASDLTIVNQVRGYLVNPEVLVMHHPCIYFDESHAETAFQNMTEYVNNRGLGLDPQTKSRRRPRTLIYSATSIKEAHVADYVWVVKDGTVTELEDKHKQNDLSAYF